MKSTNKYKNDFEFDFQITRHTLTVLSVPVCYHLIETIAITKCMDIKVYRFYHEVLKFSYCSYMILNY